MIGLIFIGFFLAPFIWGFWKMYKDYIKSKEPEITEEYYEEIPEPKIKPLEAKLTEEYLSLDNYVGQKNNINYLMGHINNSKKIDKALPHIVLWGGGGLGKSTLIKAISHKIGGRFIELAPANIRSLKDVFGALLYKTCYGCNFDNPFESNKCEECGYNLKVYFIPTPKVMDRDIVFFEEVHQLKAEIEESLYSLMQDGYLVVKYDNMEQIVEFPDITIAGATTRLGDLNKPFRDRFKLDIHLQPYTLKEMQEIIGTYCEHKNIEINDKSAEKISSISAGIPRIAKKYVDDAITRGEKIGEKEINEVLTLKNIDNLGLSLTHRDILEYIHIRNQAGSTAIASSVGITSPIYLEIYEPILLYHKLIWQGSRGRTLTEKCRDKYFEKCKCRHCDEN